MASRMAVGLAFAASVALVGAGGAGCKGGKGYHPPAGATDAAAPSVPDAAAASAPDAPPARDAAPEADKPMAPEVPTVVLPEPGDTPAEPEPEAAPGPAAPGAAATSAAEDARAVTRVVTASRGRTNACAEEDDGGTVVVHVTVSPQGELMHVSTDGDRRDHLVKCATRALRAAHFPRLGHETTVSVKFDFPVFLR